MDVGRASELQDTVFLRGPWADSLLKAVQTLARRGTPAVRSRSPIWVAGRAALDLGAGRVPDLREPITLFRPDAIMATFEGLATRLPAYESIDVRARFEVEHPAVAGSAKRHMFGALIPVDARMLKVVTPSNEFVVPVLDPARVVLAQMLDMHRRTRDVAGLEAAAVTVRRAWTREQVAVTTGLLEFKTLLGRIARNGGADLAEAASTVVNATLDRLPGFETASLDLPLGLRTALRDATHVPDQHRTPRLSIA